MAKEMLPLIYLLRLFDCAAIKDRRMKAFLCGGCDKGGRVGSMSPEIAAGMAAVLSDGNGEGYRRRFVE
jgi:hypothetical protein